VTIRESRVTFAVRLAAQVAHATIFMIETSVASLARLLVDVAPMVEGASDGFCGGPVRCSGNWGVSAPEDRPGFGVGLAPLSLPSWPPRNESGLGLENLPIYRQKSTKRP
jgi:hypothetical protein